MAITEHDLELFAARVRPQFPRELRDTEEFGGGFVLPDAFAGRTNKATFREWVEYVARERRAA